MNERQSLCIKIGPVVWEEEIFKEIFDDRQCTQQFATKFLVFCIQTNTHIQVDRQTEEQADSSI